MLFRYKAVDPAGNTVSGALEAATEQEAARQLGGQGLTVFMLRAQEPGLLSGRRRARASTRELQLVLQEFTTLLEAGVTLVVSLSSLAKSSHHPQLTTAFASMEKSVRRGESFSVAMQGANLKLPEYFHQLVQAGEATGRLAESLRAAVEQFEYDQRVAGEFRSALIYPAVLMGSGIAAVAIIFLWVVPRFGGLLTDALLAKPVSELRRAATWFDYAFRRVLRIWPLYLVVLLFSWWSAAVGVSWWHYRIDAVGFVDHLSLRAGQSVLWSIPVEFKFYVWLPLVALGLAAARHRGVPWPAGAILGGLVVLGLCLLWPPGMAEPNDIRLRPYVAIFVLGALAAYVHRSVPAVPAGGRAAWGAAGALALAVFVATIPAIWAVLGEREFDPLVNHRWFVFFGLLWALLLLCTLHGPRWLTALFSNRVMRGVGLLSYSIYLWHMPVIDGLKAAGWASGPIAALLALAGTMMVSVLSYLIIERPLQPVRFRWQSVAARTGPR